MSKQTSTLPTRALGTTGMNITRVGFGAWAIGGGGWAFAWGFSGILIAFLALRTPLLIPVWAVVFGMLAAAGPQLKAQASVPEAIVLVMQTLPVIVLFLLLWLARVGGGRSAKAAGE